MKPTVEKIAEFLSGCHSDPVTCSWVRKLSLSGEKTKDGDASWIDSKWRCLNPYGDEKMTVVATQERILKAYNLCRDNHPAVWARFQEEQYDAGDSDILAQLMAYGEEIYG